MSMLEEHADGQEEHLRTRLRVRVTEPLFTAKAFSQTVVGVGSLTEELERGPERQLPVRARHHMRRDV